MVRIALCSNAVLLLLCPATGTAEPPYWQNPTVVGHNQELNHCTFVPYATYVSAITQSKRTFGADNEPNTIARENPESKE